MSAPVPNIKERVEALRKKINGDPNSQRTETLRSVIQYFLDTSTRSLAEPDCNVKCKVEAVGWRRDDPYDRELVAVISGFEQSYVHFKREVCSNMVIFNMIIHLEHKDSLPDDFNISSPGLIVV